MNRNEHNNNLIGSISLLFSLLVIVSISSKNNDSSHVNQSDTIKHIERVNNVVQSIEPTNLTKHFHSFANYQFSGFLKNHYAYILETYNNQNHIKICIADHIFCNQKHNFITAQLLISLTNQKEHPLIS